MGDYDDVLDSLSTTDLKTKLRVKLKDFYDVGQKLAAVVGALDERSANVDLYPLIYGAMKEFSEDECRKVQEFIRFWSGLEDHKDLDHPAKSIPRKSKTPKPRPSRKRKSGTKEA